MNQKMAVAVFFAGLATFLSSTGEVLTQHQSWRELTLSPAGVGHCLLIGAAFATLVTGALGIQLPRRSGSSGDRSTDPKE
jgi:hypothetical protein